MEELEPDASERFLESSRFWIQRVLVPVVVFIGLGGNIVTVKVLTRRRMRCTTTIYLTALAVADLVYLLFVLLLSFQHYPNIHHRKFELYWRFYGISHWICDAASSTSVWLTVSFTLERYLVVCHPIKGKVLCTEGRAKNIIALVGVLCLLTTLSTTFEYEISVDERCVDYANMTTYDRNVSSALEKMAPSVDSAGNFSSNAVDDQIRLDFNASTEKEDPANCTCGKNETSEGAPKKDCSIFGDWVMRYSDMCCKVNYTIDGTALGKNVTYRTVFYWYSAVMFGLLPLLLIATFNTFLVRAVYKSRTKRKKMTNSQENATQNQENRITLLLISVVVLFLMCQTPTACFLIYDPFSGSGDPYVDNIKKALGNIFNFLLTLNAACNFILYCVLSDRYRKTFRMLFCERRLNRSDTSTILSRSRTSQKFDPNANGFKRSKTEYGRTPRNLETQSLTSLPPFHSKSLINHTKGKTEIDTPLV